MPDTEFLLALLVAVAALARVAGLLNVPYPVLLVLGGLVLGLIPGLPDIRLEPRTVLLIFLPPLLYRAAFLTSPRALRDEAAPIGALAIGLVLATMLAVGLVAHTVVGSLSWAEAFTLGAIVGPTDPVAATSVFRRLGLPGRMTTILEGESLVNDGIALVAFRVAVVAALTGTFSFLDAAGQFFGASIAGIGIGLIAGWVVTKVRARIDDAEVEIALSLFTPYLAYVPAERIGASGVLAAVTVGLYLAYQAPTGLFHPSTRLQATAFWDVLVFLLNSLLFILVGLQFQQVLDALGDRSEWFLAGAAAAVAGVTIVTRMAWMTVVPDLLRVLTPNRLHPTEATPLRERGIIGWSGMRGAVSLAAALSVPFDLPGRPFILFLTFTVILATLVGQGLTATPIARRLIQADPAPARRQEAEARTAATRAALAELDRAAAEDGLRDDTVRYARRRYELRLRHLGEEDDVETLPATRELERRLVRAERETIERLYAEGRIDQEIARHLERELDLEEERWGEQEESALG